MPTYKINLPPQLKESATTPSTTVPSTTVPSTPLTLGGLPLLKEKLNSLSSNSPVDVNDIEGKGALLKPLPQSRNFPTTIVGNPVSAINPTNLFTDIDEITLSDGDFYPNNQPLLARAELEFQMPNVGVEDKKSSTTEAVSMATKQAESYASTILSVAGVGEAVLLEDRPQKLISFDYNRTIDGIGQFSLVLFDSTWTEIEEKLVKSKGEFRLRYGYFDGNQNTISPWYQFKAFQYKVDFKMQGVVLNISGLGTGWKMNIGVQYDSYEGYKVSDLVKKIAENSGLFTDYKTWVEETADIEDLSDMLFVGYFQKKYCQTAETNFQFVINKLIPYARNKAGQGNYVLFFDNTPTGETVLHFHTPYFRPRASASPTTVRASLKRAQQLAGVGNVPAFTLFKDKNSPVINFMPDWRMSTIQLAGGGGTFNTIIDANTKQVLEIKSDLTKNNKVIQSTDNKPNIVEENLNTYSKTAFFIDKDQYARYSREIKAKNDAGFSTRIIGAIRGSLNIVGTPNFRVMERVAVLVYVPSDESKISSTVNAIVSGANVLKTITKKNIHWISGYFRILRIRDRINASGFVTTLELVTDTRGEVADKPVEMDEKK